MDKKRNGKSKQGSSSYSLGGRLVRDARSLKLGDDTVVILTMVDDTRSGRHQTMFVDVYVRGSEERTGFFGKFKKGAPFFVEGHLDVRLYKSGNETKASGDIMYPRVIEPLDSLRAQDEEEDSGGRGALASVGLSPSFDDVPF